MPEALNCEPRAQPVVTAQRDGSAYFCFRESLIAWLTCSVRQRRMTTLTARSWEEIRSYYLSFGEGPWLAHHRPMLNLVAWLEKEVSGEIFGSVGISGLYLCDRAQFGWCEHMLQITMMPTPGFTL